MDKEKRLMAAQAASLSRIGTRILNGLKLCVKWILPPKDVLGYTADGIPITVNVAWDHDYYMGDMDEDEKIFFRMGVFAHETLHQVFTNFRYSNKICDSLSQAEAAIFMKFANTLEDPAIEHFAPNVMGGKLLAALKYSIATIYKKSPGVETSKEPFMQMLNALIHFGDCGIVKGYFTFPEAEEYFRKIAPLYNEGIICPDSKKRLDIAKECMEITRPLWEEYVKDQEAWEKLIEELLEFLQKKSSPAMDESELADDASDDAKSAARAQTLSMSDKDSDKKGKKSKSKADKTDDDNSDGKSDDDSDDADSSSSTDNESDQEGSTSSQSEGDNDASGQQAEGDASEQAGDRGTPLTEDEILEEDLYIDDKMMDSIREELAEEEKKIEKSEDESPKGSPSDLPSYNIDSAYFKHAVCLNRQVKNVSSSMKEEYNHFTKEYQWEIRTLTKALAKLFSADKEEELRATSGSYNIKRGTIGCTARIMDKRRDPSNRKDAAVCLAIDLSGSMTCENRIGQARKTSIVLSEALRNLNIPYYIMGFKADTAGAQAVHEHFVTWDGKGRESLITMRASDNNFDGYSIRYASNLLKPRTEKTKILFVISDGEPACMTYCGRGIGNQDTLQAVKEAKKSCKVFGIAIGSSCSPETLQSFYGKDFIHCSDVSLLSNVLSKKLVKMFK